MILAYSKGDFKAVRAFLSMSYWTSNGFRQGGLLWPRNTSTSGKASLSQSTLYPSSPARTPTSPNSTASQQTICQLQNGWAETRPFAGCTARSPGGLALPAAHASASEKARSCNPPSCLRQLLSALSNASDMAAPSKPLQTSVMLIREPSSAYRKRQAESQDAESLQAAWYAAMVAVAVERPVQLDACTRFFEGLLSGDGAGADSAYLDGSGVCSLSDAYQRTPATAMGRPAQDALESALEKYQRKKSLPTS